MCLKNDQFWTRMYALKRKFQLAGTALEKRHLLSLSRIDVSTCFSTLIYICWSQGISSLSVFGYYQLD